MEGPTSFWGLTNRKHAQTFMNMMMMMMKIISGVLGIEIGATGLESRLAMILSVLIFRDLQPFYFYIFPKFSIIGFYIQSPWLEIL